MSLPRPTPVWFGPEDSPLFGVLHMPDSPARGAVVLCPPLGREYTYSHSTFAELATRLSELGFGAFRFDYRSTGDSFDRIADGARASGFEHDVGLAVGVVRAMGVAHVGIVGMRLGANLTCAQRGFEPVDAVVLWDPCPTGRSFLREQRALGLFAVVLTAGDDADPLDFPGFELSPEMSDEISRLDLLAGELGPVGTGALCERVLLLTRSERVADRKLAARFDLPHVEHREVPGQPELLNKHDDWPVVPTESLATVASWLDKVMPQSGPAIVMPSCNEVAVRVPSDGPSPGGTPDRTVLVRERSVQLGPEGLFGIETIPDGGGSGPVCIFVSVANEHRIGPGRLWVQLSRVLAAKGFRCVRFDVNGFGDSPARAGLTVQRVLSVSAIDDVVEVARAVSPKDPGDVVLFGLCSSGYEALEAALSLLPRGVCAINPSVLFRPPEMASSGMLDARRRFCVPQELALAAARESRAAGWLKRRTPWLTSRVSRGLWTVVGFFRNGPGARLGDLVRGGTEVLLIGNEHELEPFLESGVSAVRRSRHKERLHIEVIHALNHALLPSRDRRQVTELILDFVTRRWA